MNGRWTQRGDRCRWHRKDCACPRCAVFLYVVPDTPAAPVAGDPGKSKSVADWLAMYPDHEVVAIYDAKDGDAAKRIERYLERYLDTGHDDGGGDAA